MHEIEWIEFDVYIFHAKVIALYLRSIWLQKIKISRSIQKDPKTVDAKRAHRFDALLPNEVT